MPSSGERAAGPSWAVVSTIRPLAAVSCNLSGHGRLVSSALGCKTLAAALQQAASRSRHCHCRHRLPRALAPRLWPLSLLFVPSAALSPARRLGARQDRGPMTQRDFSLAEIKGCVRRDTSNDSAWQQAEQSRQYRYILVAPHLIAPDSATGSPAALSNRPVFLAGVLKSASDSQFQRRP